MAVNLSKFGAINAVKFWCILVKIGKVSKMYPFTENLAKLKKCKVNKW